MDDSACPVTGVDYNPMVPPYRDDPFPFYAWSRGEQPVTFLPPIGAWAVTRYDDIVRILHDPGRFSSAASVPPWEVLNPPEVIAALEGTIPPGRISVLADPPEHGALRAVESWGFRGPRVNGLRPRMREIANELVDGFIADGRADLVEQFAEPYVYRVAAALAGVPETDVEQLRAWTADQLTFINPLAPLDDKLGAAARLPDYDRYVLDLMEKRQVDPLDDLMSDLVHLTPEQGGPLPLATLAMMWRSPFTAGTSTPRDGIISAVFSMLTDRRHWEQALSDPSVVPAMLEEALRRDAPHRGLMRTTTEEVQVGGVTLPAGSHLLLLFGSANRDETHFGEPDVFRPGRSNVREHLAFGQGIHHCVGANMARAESRIALEVLTERLPSLHLDEGYIPHYRPEYFFRGLRRLNVAWPP